MTAPQPEIYRIFTEMDALHEGLRDRAEDLNVSRLELDELAGLTPGYASKLLSDPPMKFIGPQTLPKILKGTGLALALIVDDGRTAQIAAKSTKRKYRIGRLRAAAEPVQGTVPSTERGNIHPIDFIKKYMSELGKKGDRMAKSNGAKRQAKEMRKRARKRRAAHAARMRWAKGS